MKKTRSARAKSARAKSTRAKSTRKSHTLVGGKNKRNNKSRRRGKSVRHLIRGGVDNDTDDDEEEDMAMALFLAVQSRNADTLKPLLVTERSRINDLSNEDWDHVGMGGRQWTLLHLALIREDEITDDPPSLQIVKMLLDVEGLDVNQKDSKGKTPLMVAKGVDFVKLLLGHRDIHGHPDINVNERDNNGSTALWLLANLPGPSAEQIRARLLADTLEIAQLLIDAGEDTLEIAQLLIDAGADTLEIAQLLIDADADRLEIAQLLIDAGADVDIRGADGTTPLEVAEKRGFGAYVEKFSRRERRSSFAKVRTSIKNVENSRESLMKVLQNEDLAREIRKYL